MRSASCQNWYHHWIILLVSTLSLHNALWSLQRKSFMGIFGEPDSVLNWTDSCWVTRISISCIFKIQHSDFQRTVRESDPLQLLLSFQRIEISASIVLSGKCWFLAHQPKQVWLPSQPISVFFWHPVDQLLARQLLKIISYSLASASLASIMHKEFTTPTPCHTAGSTWLTEAKLKMQEAFSFSFLGRAFYAINQLLEQTSKRQWVRHLTAKII